MRPARLGRDVEDVDGMFCEFVVDVEERMSILMRSVVPSTRLTEEKGWRHSALLPPNLLTIFLFLVTILISLTFR